VSGAQASHRPPTPPTDQRWRDSAVCAQTDAALWHPGCGDRATLAKQICRRCPVQPECLEHALTHNECGIWGGTTETGRRQLRRARLKTANRPSGSSRPDFGARMWLWRTAAGLTQPQAAAHVGVSTDQWANYEIGRRTPTTTIRACIDTIIGGP